MSQAFTQTAANKNAKKNSKNSPKEGNSNLTKTKTETETWKQNLVKLVSNDVNAKRNEYYLPSPQFLVKMFKVNDEDRPLFYCLFNCFVMISITICLLPYLYNKPWYYIAILAVLRMVLLCLPRFILALHFSAHKNVINPESLNQFIVEIIIAPFMGIPPGLYRFHHIIMHHKEDNIHPQDLSSTMPYQRDNMFHFMQYWARFEIGAWFELPYYLFKKKYYRMCFEGVAMLLSYIILNYVLWQIRPAFSLWLFLMPQFLLSFLLMFGNWSQHIFVDTKHYDDDHQLTINLINTPYNQLTFNDGYHILHHKYPTLHWTQLPSRLLDERELKLHAKSNAITFNDIDYFLMGVYVMTGNLPRLARHFVPLSKEQSTYSISDIVNLFKRRLVAIPCH